MYDPTEILNRRLEKLEAMNGALEDITGRLESAVRDNQTQLSKLADDVDRDRHNNQNGVLELMHKNKLKH